MTVPIAEDTIYGSTYDCRRKCPKCKNANWYDLTATLSLMCLKCGHQELIEE